MFKDQINKLFESIQAHNKEIARYSSIDSATISRLRTGKRTPKPTSPTIDKFIDGIVLYAKDHDKMDNIYQLLKTDGIPSTANNCQNNLKIWLYYNYDSENTANSSKSITPPFSSFGRKLSEIMQMADLSNAKLGRMINLDPSHISRFRNGHRTPKSNPDMIIQICQSIIEQFAAQDNTDRLVKHIHAPAAASTDENILFIHLRKWLCDSEPDDNIAINQLLQNMDSLSQIPTNSLPPLDSVATDDVRNDTSSYYVGDVGLQKAVIRFLASAIIKGAKELLLYSDLEMNWMADDPAFRISWISLMSECINHGIHIKIIHNIDRDTSEMIQAIRSWLPLYMSGMIEPYYCTLKKGQRFSHTLFLCPGVACIEAYHTAGDSSGSLYNYHTDSLALEYLERRYHNLLKSSHILVRMQLGKPIEEITPANTADEYHNICITLHKSSVVVYRTTAPYITFAFLHPLMYESFRIYIEQQS